MYRRQDYTHQEQTQNNQKITTVIFSKVWPIITQDQYQVGIPNDQNTIYIPHTDLPKNSARKSDSTEKSTEVSRLTGLENLYKIKRNVFQTNHLTLNLRTYNKNIFWQ